MTSKVNQPIVSTRCNKKKISRLCMKKEFVLIYVCLNHGRLKRVLPIRSLRKPRVKEMRRGLCYWCDEKYTFGHKCKSSQLYMLMIQNDGRDKEEVKISLIAVLQKE